MSTRRILQGLLLLGGFTISACTAILVPDEGNDGVVRCNITSDCPDIDDNRYVPACVFGEGQPENSDKICAADYNEVSCGETAYDANHPLSAAWADADNNRAAYSSCAAENRGMLGCRPNGSSCDGDLEVNLYGTCDTPDAVMKAISAFEAGLGDAAGKDVQDQFCQSYFCDERFVCDTSLSKPVCVECDPDDPFGEGGCARLYIDAAVSSVYKDPDNCSGNTGTDAITFGDVPMLP